MRFTDEFIERVRDATSIVDLIGQHVQLTKAGSSHRGLCPFPGHAEKSPSFFVSDIKQLYHCFGCKKGGTVYNFLMDFQGLTFPQAVEYLAQRANIQMPAKSFEEKRNPSNSDEKSKFFKVNKYVSSYYFRNLQSKTEDHPARVYLKMRGLTPEIIEEFQIGFSENSWDNLVSTLKKAKAPLDITEKLGLIKKKNDGGYFDIFRDRIIFPIYSSSQEVLGFGGRILTDQQPKYLNSPETPVFNKGRTLYGLNNTAKFIRAADEAFVVEGYMDCLALYKNGIKNVVATLGTAFTLEHAYALKKLCSKVIILFDGDAAGQAAAERSLGHFLEAGLNSRWLVLPGELDPDDFLKEKGAESLRELANRAPDHFVAFFNKAMVNFHGRASEKVEILKKMEPFLAKVQDSRLRNFYTRDIIDRLDLDPKWAGSWQNLSGVANSKKSPNIKKIDDKSAFPKEELLLVQFMLMRKDYLELIQASGVIELFMHNSLKTLAQTIVEKYCQKTNDFDTLPALLISEGFDSNLISGHIVSPKVGAKESTDSGGELKLIQDCLTRVKDRQLKLQSKALLNSLKADSASSPDKLEIFMKIAQQQKGLKNP